MVNFFLRKVFSLEQSTSSLIFILFCTTKESIEPWEKDTGCTVRAVLYFPKLQIIVKIKDLQHNFNHQGHPSAQ